MALACLALVSGQFVSAQPQPSSVAQTTPQAVQAQRLMPGESLLLDGRLNHPAWLRAPIYSQFVERHPVNGVAPQHRTLVRVLYDDDAIYVGVEALDPEPTGSLTYALRRSGGTVFYAGASRSHDSSGGVPGGRSNEFFIKLQADVDEFRRR